LVNGAVDFSSRINYQTNPVSPDGDRLVRTQFQHPDQNYGFFLRNFQFPIDPENGDFLPNPTDASKPDPNNPADYPFNGPAYYHEGDDLTITDDWHVESDETIVVFINGNLNLNARTSVDEGGFLAFIVSGNINVSPNLASDNKNDPAMSGVFIANGEVRFETLEDPNPDNLLVTNGTIVGWGGVIVERDFRSATNNTVPVVLFTFRPDFVTNAPAEFNTTQYFWEEVAP
jgi:hypothetical protein